MSQKWQSKKEEEGKGKGERERGCVCVCDWKHLTIWKIKKKIKWKEHFLYEEMNFWPFILSEYEDCKKIYIYICGPVEF